MRPTREQTWLDVAELIARRSTCARLQVGCVLTDTAGEQVWVGYNGGPRGGLNVCRHPDTPGGCGCVHAEANAVVKAPGGVPKLAYLTHSPCATCAVMLVNAHVRGLMYRVPYRDDDGIRVLQECGVKVLRAA